MSARDELLGHIIERRGQETAERITDRILAEHAHELAEKIRANPPACGRDDNTLAALDAADLIDPEVNT